MAGASTHKRDDPMTEDEYREEVTRQEGIARRELIESVERVLLIELSRQAGDLGEVTVMSGHAPMTVFLRGQFDLAAIIGAVEKGLNAPRMFNVWLEGLPR